MLFSMKINIMKSPNLLPLLLVIFFKPAFALDIKKPAKIQYGFVENKGQITDQNNKPNTSVLYLLACNGLHVQLKQNSFSYEVIKKEPLPIENDEINSANQENDKSASFNYSSHRIDISFMGSNPTPAIIGSDAFDDYINFYVSNKNKNGIVEVHHFKKIVYQNIYPFIDIEFVFYEDKSEQVFKYNFIVHPGGDINLIKLKYNGALNTSLNSVGNILLKTSVGIIEERIPHSFIYDESKGKKIEGNKINVYFESLSNENNQTNNIYGFKTIDYDKTNTLVIDPSPWATYFGSDKDEQGYDVVTDSTGNVLIVGRTTSTHNIATNGAFQTVFGSLTLPGSDAFILKMDASGNRIWSTYFGGSAEETGQSISTNNQNEIVICGSTTSLNMFTTVGAFKTTYSVGISPPTASEMFLAKFNSEGFIQWSTFFGGVGNESGGKVKFDHAGNICFVGTTESYNLIASIDAFKTINAGGMKDAFIAKFNTNGNRLWSTFYGGDSFDLGNDISIDKWNNIFVIGTTGSSNNIATTSVHKPALGSGGTDAFIVKFNEFGQRQFGSYFGSIYPETGNSIAVSDSGSIYMVGATYSSSNIATVGTFQTTPSIYINSFGDGFIAKFDSTCMLLWSSYYGDSLEDVINKVVVNKKGNIYLIGTTNSKAVFASNIAHQQTSGGAHDVFVANFENNGNRLWGTFYGGTGSDYGYGICEDKEDYIYITGTTNSSNAIATGGAFNSVPDFGSNAFVSKFTAFGGLEKINNNSFTDYQFIFKNTLADTLIGSIPTDGYGAFTYKWISSENGKEAVYSDAKGVNNLVNYAPGIINKTTWYKRIVYSGAMSDTSLAKAVFAYDSLSNNKITAPLTVCSGAKAYAGGTNVLGGFGIGYKWLVSTIDSVNGFFDTLSRNEEVNFTFTPTANKVWLKRVAYSLDRSDTSNTISIMLTSAPHPQIGYTLNNAIQCFKGNSFMFTDTSTVSSGTLTRKWMFNDSIVESTNNVFNKSFTKSGVYYAKLLVETNLGCKDSITYISLLVYPQTPLFFSVNQNKQCKQNEFVFTDKLLADSFSHEAYKRIWVLGNGDIDSSNNITITKTYSPGNYTVLLLTKSLLGCMDTFTQTISVSNADKPMVGFLNTNTGRCLNNNSFNFIDTSQSLTTLSTRVWSFGDATFSSDSIHQKRYQTGGLFPVKLKITNGNDCADSVTKWVQVFQVPKPLVEINKDKQCFADNRFVLKEVSNRNYGIYWFLGDSTFSSNLIVNKTYNRAGVFEIKLIASDSNNCSDTLISHVEVYATPAKPIISRISNTQLSSSLAYSYQWYLNDILLANDTLKDIQIDKNGKYKVKTTNANGCFIFSDSLVVRNVGINELHISNEVSVYPNPFSDNITISYRGLRDRSVSVELTDVLGKSIFSEKVKISSGNAFSINTDNYNLTKGVYILKVNNECFKIIKE